MSYLEPLQGWVSFSQPREKRLVKPFQPIPLLILSVVLFDGLALGQSTLDREWKSNVVLDDAKNYTLPEIGGCQGFALLNRKLYFYGVRYDVSARRREIHQYDLEMKPTGRRLILNRSGRPLLTHPTGIAYLDKNRVFIGNTVNQQARIFVIDWEQAWRDGVLDRAVKTELEDGLAVNGCRPITIAAFGKRFSATANYGSRQNHIRLYDPALLASATKTSKADLMVQRFDFGEFNQNLDWHGENGQLVGIPNVVAGLGWRLLFVDLGKAIQCKSGRHREALVQEMIFPAHTELEGFRVLPAGKFLLVTAHRENNVWIGKPRTIAETSSKRGHPIPFYSSTGCEFES